MGDAIRIIGTLVIFWNLDHFRIAFVCLIVQFSDSQPWLDHRITQILKNTDVLHPVQFSDLIGLGLDPEILGFFFFFLNNSLGVFNVQLCTVWLVHKPVISIIKFSWFPLAQIMGKFPLKHKVKKKPKTQYQQLELNNYIK